MATSESPARFIVTGVPRTGSNLVLHSLAAHPEVLAFNELFNESQIYWGSKEVDEEMGLTYLPFRNERPLPFIEHVFTPELPEIRSVGFKLFYMHGTRDFDREKFRLVWPYMRRMKGLKVVDMVRDNWLKQAFSWIKAQRNKVWFQTGLKDAAPQKAITISPQELHATFRWYDEMQKLRSRLIDGLDVLVVHYEELAADFTKSMARIQEFIGVEPQPLQPATRKQRTRAIHRSIANYEELRERFMGTPYFRYFEMSEEERRCRRAEAA